MSNIKNTATSMKISKEDYEKIMNNKEGTTKTEEVPTRSKTKKIFKIAK